jgi:hypothetical protein
LAHARRARHRRTFSEDDRIQASVNVKKIEDEDSGEISEAEDPMMLSRDAKDWKVSQVFSFSKCRQSGRTSGGPWEHSHQQP